MALPSTGAISFNAINVELGLTATAQISMNDTAVRTLFGVASGAIGMNNGYGKSNRVPITVTIASNTTNYTLSPSVIPGYVAGKTDVTLVVNSGVYVYSTNTANAGLTVAAFAAGDTVAITNNGYIMGMGGAGGSGSSNQTTKFPPTKGSPAIDISYPVSITNNSYIAGGGGGGAYGVGSNYVIAGGGGGAGGGAGGYVIFNSTTFTGGTGGAAGAAGGNGTAGTSSQGAGGGGGGRILPGLGGVSLGISNNGRAGVGGGSGASGGSNAFGGSPVYVATGGSGGNSNNSGNNGGITGSGTGFANAQAAGGGGGWGASGGSGIGLGFGGTYNTTGAEGGKAVNLNGYTVTWLVTGTRYGAIS